jgi:hypothetical protein
MTVSAPSFVVTLRGAVLPAGAPVSSLFPPLVDKRRILPTIAPRTPAMGSFGSLVAPMHRPNAPLHAPTDVTALLKRFGLTVSSLLTISNPKTLKDSKLARSVILHHLPSRGLANAINPLNNRAHVRGFLADLARLAERENLTAQVAGFNACAWATAACIDCCLNTSGHGGMSTACASCRGRRQLASIADSAAYARAILWAIARERLATNRAIPLAVRLRGTDDKPWHLSKFTLSAAECAVLHRRFGITCAPGDNQTMADVLQIELNRGRIVLYDYSAAPLRGPLGIIAQRAAGWDVTHSVKPDGATPCADAIAAIRAGFRVAIPVAMRDGDTIPTSLSITTADDSVIVPTVNGDTNDHRWSNPGRTAVVLRYKIARGADPANVARFAIARAGTVQLKDGIIGWAA